MRIDVVSIFPDYLAPLNLSLVGKAVTTGLVDLRVHDLRSWTHDRHRTVDDTPYGGGAGMVMKPEPWGEAMDDLLTGDAAATDPLVVLLTPSGQVFDQTTAARLSDEQRVIFACGRYEGIDARVAAHLAGRVRTVELSIGDYVLNGGEAAALVIIEAMVRLIPGVIGNPESLTEESHAAGHDQLLEYPSYTKPPRWRELDVPPVLLSGHHGEVARWRRERAVELTASRRPELLPAVDQPVLITEATRADAGELTTLQRAAYLAEGRLHSSFAISPLTQTPAELAASLEADDVVLVARRAGRLIGSVRAGMVGDGWEVGRLMVAPDVARQGLGSRLLRAIEDRAPEGCHWARLFTGATSSANLAFYARHGYVVSDRRTDEASGVELAALQKPLEPRAPETDRD